MSELWRLVFVGLFGAAVGFILGRIDRKDKRHDRAMCQTNRLMGR